MTPACVRDINSPRSKRCEGESTNRGWQQRANLCVGSGGVSAVKEPGHFEVRKSSSQVTRMHFFLQKVDLFYLSPSKHRPLTSFHRQNKTNKAVRYGNIFIFCSHYYRIHRARQGGARAVELPAKSFDLARPGVAPPLCVGQFTLY